MLELGESDDDPDDLHWDFPAKLHPLGKQGEDYGLVYDIVGRGLHNPTVSHYITQYRPTADSPSIYTYDGMKNGGYSIRQKNSKLKTHLCGPIIEVPSGYRTDTVVYCLRGGHKAQQKFYEGRISSIEEVHSLKFSSETLETLAEISYTNDDLVPMPNSDRYWMKNPYMKRRTEYITSNKRSISPSLSAEIVDVKPGPHSPSLEPPSLHPSPVLSPAPSIAESYFPFNCRCGVQGNGNIIDHRNGPAVMCATCEDWSHIACQREGRASNLGKKQFVCDFCSMEDIRPGRHLGLRASNRL